MASYYYLIAGLPMLRADGEIPFGYEEFLSQCASAVDEETYEKLASLTLASDEGPLLSDWAVFYRQFAEELAYQRLVRMGRPAEVPAERDADAIKAVTAAIAAKNPLEAEEILLELQFEKLDELVSLHFFDETVLFGYALKLRLLERKAAFDKAAGRAEFDRLFRTVQEQVLKA